MGFESTSSESHDDDKETSSSDSKVSSAKPIGEILFRQEDPHERHEGLLRLFDKDEKNNTDDDEDSDKVFKPGISKPIAKDAKDATNYGGAKTEVSTEAPKSAAASENDVAEQAPATENEDDLKLGELTHTESREVAAALLQNDAERLQAERAMVSDESMESFGLVGAEALVDRTQQKLEIDASITPEQALDEASNEILDEINGSEAPANDRPVAETTPPTSESPEDTDPDTTTIGNLPTNSSSGTAGRRASVSPPPPPPSGPNPPSSPPGGNPPPPPLGPNFPPPPGGPPQPNTPPNPYGNPGYIPNAGYFSGGYSRYQLAEAARRGENRGLVTGGVLGYLLGRRRGRIKSEKRLLPVQEKLQTQVTNLELTIASKEQKIRTLAVEKAKVVSQVERTNIIERLKPTSSAETAAQPASAHPEFQPTQTPNALKTPNTITAELPKKAPEYIDQPQTPDQFKAAAVELFAKQPEALQRANNLEVVRKMTREQLMQTAEKVMIDGTSLRMIYESKQITEPGLKRILVEHLGGNDLRQILKKELLAKELTYERDPHIRDALAADPASAQSTTATKNSGDSTPSQPGLLSQFPATTPKPPLPDIPLPDGRSSVSNNKKASNRTQQVVVSAWVVLVVVLAVAAFVLILR